MRKPIRTPLNPEQLADAERLKKAYLEKVAESKAKGEKPALNQSEVGEKCGWNSPQSTVSQYLNGKVALNLDALLKLADVLGIKEPWKISPTLAGGLKRVAAISSTPNGSANAANTPFPVGGDAEAAEDKYAHVPQLTARAAAGLGSENPHVESNTTLAFKRDWLRTKGAKAENLLVIYAEGESMWPTINDHDVLLVDKSKIDPADGHVFVLSSTDKGAIVKRLVQSPLGGWIIRSDNEDKTEYGDLLLSRSDVNEHRIIGRVIWRGGDL
jgi:phage repressor protein C with HTH and peptisase S24 domain